MAQDSRLDWPMAKKTPALRKWVWCTICQKGGDRRGRQGPQIGLACLLEFDSSHACLPLPSLCTVCVDPVLHFCNCSVIVVSVIKQGKS